MYVYRLDDTVWARGSTNVTHRSMILNAGNARWICDFSQPGEFLTVWQIGDWSLSWDQWQRGSALS